MNAVDAATQALLQARRSGHSTAAVALPDAEAAYAVQAGVAAALGWFSDGAAARHWKSGGPSRDAQPTHAPLPPAGVWDSPADARARAWPFHFRGIEVEIALRIARDVDAALAAQLNVGNAPDIVDAMCVAIELVDSRWSEGLGAPALAKLADLQSHSALVLGPWLPFAARDWSAQTGAVTIGKAPAQTFRGTHSLGDPAFVLPAWLRHATRDGAVVRAGSVVTTGTWCGLPLAADGDRVIADFTGMGRASVQL